MKNKEKQLTKMHAFKTITKLSNKFKKTLKIKILSKMLYQIMKRDYMKKK